MQGILTGLIAQVSSPHKNRYIKLNFFHFCITFLYEAQVFEGKSLSQEMLSPKQPGKRSAEVYNSMEVMQR